MIIERFYPVLKTRPFEVIIPYFKRNEDLYLETDTIHLSTFTTENPQTYQGFQLEDANQVFPDKNFKIIIRYPFFIPCEITMSSDHPITASSVYYSIAQHVQSCYEIEEKTAPRQVYEMIRLCSTKHETQHPSSPFLCSICYQDTTMEQLSQCSELPCKHAFHTSCLTQWINTCRTEEKRSCCPMCRSFKLWNCSNCEGTGDVVEQVHDIMDPNLRTDVYRPRTYGQYGIHDSYYDDLLINVMFYHREKKILYVTLGNRHH